MCATFKRAAACSDGTMSHKSSMLTVPWWTTPLSTDVPFLPFWRVLCKPCKHVDMKRWSLLSCVPDAMQYHEWMNERMNESGFSGRLLGATLMAIPGCWFHWYYTCSLWWYSINILNSFCTPLLLAVFTSVASLAHSSNTVCDIMFR